MAARDLGKPCPPHLENETNPSGALRLREVLQQSPLSAARSAGGSGSATPTRPPGGPLPRPVSLRQEQAAGVKATAGRARQPRSRRGRLAAVPEASWTPAPRAAAERSARNLLTGPEQRAANPAGGRRRAGGRRDPPLPRPPSLPRTHYPAGRGPGYGAGPAVPLPPGWPAGRAPPQGGRASPRLIANPWARVPMARAPAAPGLSRARSSPAQQEACR